MKGPIQKDQKAWDKVFVLATLPVWIAFASDRDGDYEIYVMNANGSEQLQLTNNAGDDFDPTWSPDGTRIAFWSDRGGERAIYVMNNDGSGVRRITLDRHGNDSPDWSMAGAGFLYRSVRDDVWQVFAMNPDGSDSSYLTDGTSPDWSNDGAKIAFESYRTGPFEIYVMDEDGGNVQQLTDAHTFSHQPDWSPDGTRIAYWSARSGNGDIWVMNSDGSDHRRVTFDDGVDASPAWRPIAPPDELWSRTFGGPLFDSATVVRETSDGGFIVGGGTVSFSNGGFDVWLIKLDEDGQQVWEQVLGGVSDDDVLSIQEIDGGYVLAGITESYGSGDEDFWLIKTDESGAEVWSRTFGGAAHDRAQCVEPTPDGGFVISGETMSFGSGRRDVWLVRTDGNGNEAWSRTYGGSWDDNAYAVLPSSDGGYVLCGYRGAASGNADVWLFKVDERGNVIWERTLGGPGYDNAYSCQRTRDGGYVLAGYTESSATGDLDTWLIKTDKVGEVVWDRVYRGAGRDNAFSVRQTRDGGYALAGSSDSYGDGESDLWLGRTDALRNLLWIQVLGGAEDDLGFTIDTTSDGGYAVAGYTSSFGQGDFDGWIVRLAPEPPSMWSAIIHMIGSDHLGAVSGRRPR